MLLTLTSKSGHAVFEVFESTRIRFDYRDAQGQTPYSLAQSACFLRFLCFSDLCLLARVASEEALLGVVCTIQDFGLAVSLCMSVGHYMYTYNGGLTRL